MEVGFDEFWHLDIGLMDDALALGGSHVAWLSAEIVHSYLSAVFASIERNFQPYEQCCPYMCI